MRGKPLRTRIRNRLLRLIPACAGKTCRFFRARNVHAAHPRVCGENPQSFFTPLYSAGSSPRVRGKHLLVLEYAGSSGLIPACAGKTLSDQVTRPDGQAHPRVCGENACQSLMRQASGGSSPRVRGKLKDIFGNVWNLRLIPACAGKTPLAPARPILAPAHPRVCGENRDGLSYSCNATGSSPRVRGKPCGRSFRGRGRRLIPACAGKTQSPVAQSAECPAHPRVCGENKTASARKRGAEGSSPRVRGKLAVELGLRRGEGLIPACAGKTQAWNPVTPETEAHPRVCGENAFVVAVVSGLFGSSPRVRGKHSGLLRPRRAGGLIPACAGKTLNDLEF